MNFNEYLKYNPETGDIIWIKDRVANKLIGQIAGNLNCYGYLRIKFNNKPYMAHRLAWFLYYGVWPQNEIDHINGVRTDNRISNLRDVTSSQNQLNRKSHREKTVKYYTFDKSNQAWYVRAQINGKLKYLGYFKTEELARQFIQDNIELFPGAKP